MEVSEKQRVQSDLDDFRFADVQNLNGHTTLVAANLLEDGVEACVELAPVFELGVRTSVVRLAPHLLALRQHLTTHNSRRRTSEQTV